MNTDKNSKITAHSKKPIFTVGIVTCHPQHQLIETIKSIRNSNETGYQDFPIIIISDRTRMPKDVLDELHGMHVKVIENTFESSAYAKKEQMLKIIDTDLVVFTEDDVIFHKNTLKKIVDKFADPKVTFVGVKNEPLKAQTLIEDAINSGTNICNKIAKNWNNGDNYLACLGRVMAFRTEFIKNLQVEKDSVSLDAYIYLENKKINGMYFCEWNAPIYFRNPQSLTEHLRKSSRFQHSYKEMKSYNRFDNLDKEYKIPANVSAKAIISEFFTRPISTIGFSFIFLYTRLFKISQEKCLYPNWEVDLTTKKISFVS